jgi:hypothetical protein
MPCMQRRRRLIEELHAPCQLATSRVACPGFSQQGGVSTCALTADQNKHERQGAQGERREGGCQDGGLLPRLEDLPARHAWHVASWPGRGDRYILKKAHSTRTACCGRLWRPPGLCHWRSVAAHPAPVHGSLDRSCMACIAGLTLDNGWRASMRCCATTPVYAFTLDGMEVTRHLPVQLHVNTPFPWLPASSVAR